MLKAVIFDIDNTLYCFDEANRHADGMAAAYAQRELDIPAGEFLSACREAMLLQFRDHSETSGCHSRSIRYMMVLERYGLPLRHAPILSDLYWNELLKVIQPYPHVKEFISQLRERGILIGVGTDMTADWQLKKLDVLGLLSLIDFVVTSEEAESEKPSQQFFDMVLQKSGCLPSECLFIGDNLKKDVQGALNAGMSAWWYQPNTSQAEQHPIVTSIHGYNGLIEHINHFQCKKE